LTETQHVKLIPYDAKDPDTTFPLIEPVRPPDGAPNVLIVLIQLLPRDVPMEIEGLDAVRV